MLRSLYTATTGMVAQQTLMDVLSNNLANVQTPGFKKSRVVFQDLMYQTMRSAGSTVAEGANSPSGIDIGLGTRTGAVERLFNQGGLRQGNDYDVVIEGPGFFQVQDPTGNIFYTRDGSFRPDATGNLVTADGFQLSPAIQPIPQEAVSVSIGKDGTVTATIRGQEEPTNLGQIQLARFINPAGMRSVGRNLLEPTVASGEAIVGTPGAEGFPSVAQGFLEMSNVQIVEEMVDMITAQRAYEIGSKSIQAADEMLSVASNLRR